MYWTLELAESSKMHLGYKQRQLIDYAIRSGAPLEVLENLGD